MGLTEVRAGALSCCLAIAVISASIQPAIADELRPDPHTITIANEVPIPMRDGVRTMADIYLPSGTGPFPVVISRVPYGTQSAFIYQPQVGRFFTENGYAYVAQNVRGKHGSEGLFAAYHFGQEERDGFDTVDWVVEQGWSNGRVGLMGESYYGWTTLAAAWSGHPAIKAISPATITIAREKRVLDGAFPIQASGLWTLGQEVPPDGSDQSTSGVDVWHLPLFTMGEAHGLYDNLWRLRVNGYLYNTLARRALADERYRKVRVPALHVGGWYDSFTRGTIAIWESVRRMSDDVDVRDEQYLLMGPWDHNNMSYHLSGGHKSTNIGRLDTGGVTDTTYGEVLLEFFDHYIKEIDNGFDERTRVQYFNIGDNEWRYSDSWPPADVRPMNFYLHSNGHAGSSAGGHLSKARLGDQPVDTFSYDPDKPVTITADIDVWDRAPAQTDRSALTERPDVLTYMTEPLEEDLEITGQIRVELHAASSAVDTDFTAALVDVWPDGYSLLIQEGILRASFRDKSSNPAPIEPGKPYVFEIDLWATSFTVPRGHRLRLEISSSNFPRFARNQNTGEPFGLSDRVVIAEQTIFHTKKRPSRVILPVRD